MSDTRETDAAELIYDGIVASGYVDADISRKLERERNMLCGALREIASMDTSQDASPQQCGAVLIAMNALEEIE